MLGIVPAAGFAQRLQPVSVSKEVIRVGGKPVMDHLVERMRTAGCTDIRVVTRPEKEDVQQRARELGATVILGHPETLAQSLRSGLRGATDDEVVLFGFPDTVWDPEDGFVRLLQSLQEPYEVVLGLFKGREPLRADVVTFDPLGRIRNINLKQSDLRSQWIWGCGICRASTLEGTSSTLELGTYWNRLARRGIVKGVTLSEGFIDIGTKEALALWGDPDRR